MTDLDEAAMRRVLDRASACDPDAWEFLYRRSRLRLFRYARQRLADDATTEDAVVESVIRAIRAITDLTGPATGFDLWVAVIFRDHVLPNLRRRRTTADALRPSRFGYIDLGPTETGGGSRGEKVRQVFDALDPDVQDLLDLRVLAKLSIAETAQIIGLTPDEVRDCQVRALQHIHYLLADQAAGDDDGLRVVAEARTVPLPDLEPTRSEGLRALALAYRTSADERIPVRL